MKNTRIYMQINIVDYQSSTVLINLYLHDTNITMKYRHPQCDHKYF